MLELRNDQSVPVIAGLVYHLDGDQAQDVIRILSATGERVCFEHLEWTLDDGWETTTVVRDTERANLVKRLRRGHELVSWPVSADLVDVVFRNV